MQDKGYGTPSLEAAERQGWATQPLCIVPVSAELGNQATDACVVPTQWGDSHRAGACRARTRRAAVAELDAARQECSRKPQAKVGPVSCAGEAGLSQMHPSSVGRVGQASAFP